MSAVGRADDGAAERHDSFRAFAIKHLVIARRKQSLEAVKETEHVPTEFRGGEHDATQHRVKTGTIAAARQNANPGLRLHAPSARFKEAFADRPVCRQRPIDRKVAIRARADPRLRRTGSCFRAEQ